MERQATLTSMFTDLAQQVVDEEELIKEREQRDLCCIHRCVQVHYNTHTQRLRRTMPKKASRPVSPFFSFFCIVSNMLHLPRLLLTQRGKVIC